MTTKQQKSFVQIGRRLVSISVEPVIPPIPLRSFDWRAWYTEDHSDNPDSGWGRTAQEAIDDLIGSYEEPE